MLNMVSGLARALYILLAIIGGFIALTMINLPLVLVLLGLVAGIGMPRERMVLAAVSVVALPLVGTALANIPAIGAQLNTVMLNLQMGVAGAFAGALVIFLYERVMEGIPGLGAIAPGGKKATA